MKAKRKALLIAIALDVADFIAFGWVPILGDILDVIGIFMLFPLVGTTALLGAVELVPGLDLLPINIISVLISQKKEAKE